MRLPLTLVLLLTQSLLVNSLPAKRSYSTHDYYVLEHDPSAGASLAECVHALGVEVVEQAGELRNHWLVRTKKLDSPHVRQEDPVLSTLSNLRAHASSQPNLSTRSLPITSSVKYLARQELRQRVKRAPPAVRPNDDSTSARAVASRLGIFDPIFTQQWHLINDQYPQHMMNVSGLWEMGITGEGVITTLVDDGLDYKHPDLADNFVRMLLFYIFLLH
jgi:kexin